MITIEEYAGKWINSKDWTEECLENAEILLDKINALLTEATESGIELIKNPNTDSYISGTQYGGFRPQSCPIGAPKSSHKTGEGVDIFDRTNELDSWITDDILQRHGLYRESPSHTKSWVHLQTRPTKSGNRTFIP